MLGIGAFPGIKVRSLYDEFSGTGIKGILFGNIAKNVGCDAKV